MLVLGNTLGVVALLLQVHDVDIIDTEPLVCTTRMTVPFPPRLSTENRKARLHAIT